MPRITPLMSAADVFCEAATAALLQRAGYARPEDFDYQINPRAATELSNATLPYLARQELQLRGLNVPAFASNEQVCREWLKGSGGCIGEVDIGASAASFNRPSDFPNLLANLANKILDRALPLAAPSYPAYSAKLSDVSDFKPRTITAIGLFDELDSFQDDQETTDQLRFSEELQNFIQVGMFKNKVAMTPVMAANDDLDAFTQGLLGLAVAHENTLNRLHLAILTGNPDLADGVALFDAARGNVVDSGGAPSGDEATKMRNLMHQQSPVTGNGKIRVNMAVALVPTNHYEAAQQAFLSAAQLMEALQKTSDANINVHRGRIMPVEEPELDDYSTNLWYGFADPRILRSFVHMFQTGYSAGGKRTSWLNNENGTRYVALEGRFGAAAAGYRGAVRNPGE